MPINPNNTPTFNLYAEENALYKGPSLADNVTNTLKGVLRTALFMETLRNINWSRGYCWYCEMDGVPNPFQRGGVLGLPCTNVNFTIADGTNYTFGVSSMETIEVPRAMSNLGIVTLDLLDDEQQTLTRFFERWYNQIYNPYKGVLPLTEACKMLTIYKQKSTRTNVKRVYYNLDKTISSFAGGLGTSWLTKGKVPESTEGYDFLVFPTAPLQMSWATDGNDLNKISIQFKIAHFVNQDFGSPDTSTGITEFLGNTSGNIHYGSSLIDRITDFI